MVSIRFEEFDAAKPHTFESYIERLDCMFASRDTEESKKARNLCSPGLPSTKSYEELKTVLLGYFKPKVNVVAQRFRFHKRLQGSGELVNAYMSALRQMASACEFGEFLDDALRDQLVCGLACDKVQGRCLAATNLTLEKAFELASVMERAQEGLMWLRPMSVAPSSSTSELTVVADQKRATKPKSTAAAREPPKASAMPGKCRYCCRAATHLEDNCPFKDKSCNFCGIRGHLAKACMKKDRLGGSEKISKIETKAISSSDSDDSLPANRIVKVNHVSVSYIARLAVNKQSVDFEVDTGASCTLINKTTWEACGAFKLTAATPLQTYTGESIPTLGQATVEVEDTPGMSRWVEVTVVKSSTEANLLGRDAIEKLRFNLGKFGKRSEFMVSSVGPTSAEVKTADIKVAEICAQYPDVFKNSLGLLKATQAKLYLREGSTPKFCKPRTIPFGIKYQVEMEIKRLVLEGILEKVNFSDWATPIVPILKSDGSIRVCGDCKVTLNQELQVDQYLRSSVGSVSQKGFVRSFQHRSIPDQTVRRNVWCVPLNQC